MAQKQKASDGAKKRYIANMSWAVEMGDSVRHFEVWYRGRREKAISAIWRNETGPVEQTPRKNEQ